MHLPQQCKLSGDTYQETKNMLGVKANKTMIQQHIYRNTRKIVTLKDLYNLGSDKNTSSNDIGMLVEEMQKIDGKLATLFDN